MSLRCCNGRRRHVCRRVSLVKQGGNLLRIAVDGRVAVDMPVNDVERVWSSTIERYFASASLGVVMRDEVTMAKFKG